MGGNLLTVNLQLQSLVSPHAPLDTAMHPHKHPRCLARSALLSQTQNNNIQWRASRVCCCWWGASSTLPVVASSAAAATCCSRVRTALAAGPSLSTSSFLSQYACTGTECMQMLYRSGTAQHVCTHMGTCRCLIGAACESRQADRGWSGA